MMTIHSIIEKIIHYDVIMLNHVDNGTQTVHNKICGKFYDVYVESAF